VRSEIRRRPFEPARAFLACVLALASVAGCGRARFVAYDANVRDASSADARSPDDASSVIDVPDAGIDAAMAAPDAPMSDAWAADARGLDARVPDAWAADAWAADAFARDAWAADAFARDAWAADAWAMSAGDLLGHYTFPGDGSDGTGIADLDCSSCTYFDGGMISSANIAVPDRAELATGDYTIAAWVMVRSSQPLGSSRGLLTSADFTFELTRNSDGTGGLTVYLPRSGSSGRRVPIDAWHHLAITWNEAGSRVRTWLAGGVLTDLVVGYRPASTGLIIRPDLPIDDLVLYDRELTPTELATLAATRR